MRFAILLTLLFAAGASGCSTLVPCANAGIAPFEALPGAAGDASTGAKYAGWVVGGPLTLALAPLGALACATPWVDLPQGVDLVTAPSIALGYALEAAIGAPLWAACAPFADGDGGGDDDDLACPGRGNPSPTPPAEGSSWEARSWVPPGFLVERVPARAPPRPAEPLPASVSARYAVPEAMLLDLSARIDAALRARRASIGGDGDDGADPDDPIVLPLEAGGPALLEIRLADEDGDVAASPEGRRPLMLLTPPSEANFAARWLAARYARAGVHTAVVLRQEEGFLDPALDPAAVERKLRATVVAARAVTAALARRPEVDPARVLYLGISAGGIFGSILLALEPGISRAALIYPGGDFPSIIATSREDGVTAYREAWAARGVPPDALAAAFAREVETDPILLARHIDPSRVLLFLSAGDTSVPIAGGRALGRALGGPRTLVLAGDHESSGICFGYVLREADRFLLR